jgi:glyoxylase-like metal-dependent hydrolase (beta-lactamase superfamily II)
MTSAPRSALKLELPTPYPVGPVNAYFLDGPEPLLIDVGVLTTRSLGALRDQLRACGRRLEDVRRILLTHGHYDHAGAALRLSRECRAPVFLHEKSTLFSRRQSEMVDALFAFLQSCGAPRPLLEAAFAAFRHGGKFADLESEPYGIEPLRGGETIEVDGVALRVIATPGHSPDHLCFLDGDDVLYCGDMLLGHITPNPLLYLDADDGYRRRCSLLDYLESLRRLKGFAVSQGRPGHGANIADFAALIASNEEFICKRKDAFLGKARDGARTPYELARAVFGELDAANQCLAISEAVAYLDLLERERRVAVDWEGETIAVTLEA